VTVRRPGVFGRARRVKLGIQYAVVEGVVNQAPVFVSIARRRVNAWLCCLAVAALLPACSPACAGIVDDAKQAGREVAKVPKKVGKAARQGGRAAGQTAREGGRAVKEGAKEVGRKVTGD
jgi:hypothetical protein